MDGLCHYRDLCAKLTAKVAAENAKAKAKVAEEKAKAKNEELNAQIKKQEAVMKNFSRCIWLCKSILVSLKLRKKTRHGCAGVGDFANIDE